jgi:polar amino acid transport system substrate-binding protein
VKHIATFGIALALIAASIGHAPGATVQMIAPDIPPHFNADGTGRIGDVIRIALARCGHSVRFVVVPFGRHWKDYVDNSAHDALATAEADQEFPGHSTKPFIHLQDGATVIAGSGLAAITTADQLAGRRVVAFPAADKILGITAIVPRFGSFSMRSDRYDQIRPLFAGRADAVLADGLITAHFIQVLRERARAGQEPDIDVNRTVVFRKIFTPGPQRLYFRDRTIAADFDRCVEEMMAGGDVERIIKPYVDRYRAILGDQYPNY